MRAAIGPAYLSLEGAELDLTKRVYAASKLYEQLEGAGKVRGNGHHIRQKLSAHATRILRDRWHDKTEAAKADEERPLFMLE